MALHLGPITYMEINGVDITHHVRDVKINLEPTQDDARTWRGALRWLTTARVLGSGYITLPRSEALARRALEGGGPWPTQPRAW